MRDPATDPRTATVARLAGLLYLGTIVAGIFAEVASRGSIIVAGDAPATAQHRGARGAIRAGLLADLAMLACYVGVTALFHTAAGEH